MSELQLLEKLQIIKNKLKNNEVLTDNEYKLFTLILLGLGVGIMEWATNILINKIWGKENE